MWNQPNINAETRAILDYAKSASDDPQLLADLQFDEGGPGQPACVRAHLIRGAPGRQPDPLPCNAVRVRRLITLGYLRRDGPWLTLTPAGAAALAQP